MAARTFVLTVDESRHIPALADLIAGRVWSIDGIDQSKQEPVRITEMPGTGAVSIKVLPAVLAREAQAVGADRDSESLEQGDLA